QLQTQNVEDCFNDANNIFDENQIPSILVNSSGKKIIASHSYIPSMKWCLITEIEESEVLRPINKMFLFAILLMFSLLASVFVIAIIIGKKIASPIEKLKKSVEKITNGQIDARVAIDGNDEIGSLSRAIDSMTDSIKKSKSEIEEKVKEQTSSILERQKQMQDQQTAMVNILEDVEVEKKQNALERDKLGTILLGIGDAVMVLDTDRRIQLFNKTAENISGFTASEVIGKKCFEVLNFIYEDTGKQNTDFVDGALLHGSVVKMKNHTLLVRKDGNKVPVADSAAPLKSDSGQIIGCVVVFRDVEEEREIDRMKTEFVSVASHQLRTPLTGVKWHLEVMLDDATGLSPDQLDGLREAYDSNERMIKLVNDLLDVSRIETGRKFDIKKQPSDMIKIVESVIRDNIALAEKKKINIIKCADAPESFILQVDPDKVSQVFQNLISNAIKYSHDNSTVEIGCEHNEKDVVIYVKDSGIGIPEKDQKNIFGKFFRAENATSIQADGNGLGLYIAKSIVEAHGGKIWFESILEKGTTFYFTLPMNTPKSKKVDEDIKA
ncbi:PAS domain S-box protein, partial [Patescibacteria group bacterium]|nr:PAS domain S-box protein [Patescibacteria group bacterium]